MIRRIAGREKLAAVVFAAAMYMLIAGPVWVRIVAGAFVALMFFVLLVAIGKAVEKEKDALDDVTDIIQQRLNDIDDRRTIEQTLIVTAQYGKELQDLLWEAIPELPQNRKAEYADRSLAVRSVYLELHPEGKPDPQESWKIRRALLEPTKPPEGFVL